jgi:hypothetical protein
MKIRNGFVSNSSSSSFICDVCNTCESGMDASAEDFGMAICENGHTFCEKHRNGMPEPDYKKLRDDIFKKFTNDKYLEDDEKKEKLAELANTENEDLFDTFNDSFDDGIPSVFCPLCMFKELSDVNGFKYLMKKVGTTKKELRKEIEGKFKDYDEFLNYLGNKI